MLDQPLTLKPDLHVSGDMGQRGHTGSFGVKFFFFFFFSGEFWERDVIDG